MGNAALFNGNYVKLLKDQLKLFNSGRILTGAYDPTVTATEAEAGSIFMKRLSPILASASEYTVDNISDGIDGITYDQVAQTFTASASGPFVSGTFKIAVSTAGYVGTIFMELQSLSGSVPSGTALSTSALINISTIPDVQTETTFQFPSNYSVVSGTQYAIVFKASPGFNWNVSRAIRFSANASGTHPGNWCRRLGAGAWNVPSGDLFFKTSVQVGLAPPKFYQKIDDNTTTNWRELSSTDALTIQKVAAGVATVNGGSLILPDGRVLMTYDGAGTNPSDFETSLTITLSSLLTPTNGLKGYLYIDLNTLSLSNTDITGTPVGVYPITVSNLVMNSNEPEIVDGSRYIYLASFIADATPTWTDSNWYNAPKRVQTLPLKYVSPITYTMAPQVIGSVGSALQISQGHALDIDSFPSVLANTSWWSLSANLLDGNTTNARNLSGTVSSYSAPGLFGTDTAANIASNELTKTDALFVPASNTAPFMAAGWFKFADWTPATQQAIMSVGTAGSNNSWEIHLNSDGSFDFLASTSSATAYDKDLIVANPGFTNGTYHHVAIVFNGTYLLAYIDGRLVGQLACAAVRVPASGLFTVGSATTTMTVREVAYASVTTYNDEDVRKLASYKLTHNKNTAYINQKWECGRVRADGEISEEIGDQSWMVDKSNVNKLYVDFSDISPLDSVYLKLLDEAGQAVAVLPTKTFDTGWMQSQPTGNIAHGLIDVPGAVIVQYEMVTGEYTNLNAIDYLSWDGTNLKPDLAAFGLLTINASHKWRIIASKGANAIALKTASLTEAGIISITDQHLAGNKWLHGNFNPEDDNTYDLGSLSQRWKTVHVGPGSLVVHSDATDTKKLTIGFDSAMASLTTDATTPIELKIGASQVGLIGTNGAWTVGPAAGGVTHIFNGTVSATSGVAGPGANPVGTIIAILSDAPLTGGTYTIPAAGTVDANGWMWCGGTAGQRAIPVGNTLTGVVPDLSDGRYLRGSTTSGTTGGANTYTVVVDNHTALTLSAEAAHTHSTPSHCHTVGTYGGSTCGIVSMYNTAGVLCKMMAGDSGGVVAGTAQYNVTGTAAFTIVTAQGEGAGTTGTGSSHNHGFAQNITAHSVSSNVAGNNEPQYMNVRYLIRVK